MTSFCDLPKEIVEKIILSVPADSLVQLKFVNKFCYSLISAFINDPEFVAKHLLLTKNQSSASLLFRLPSPHVDHRLITFPLLTIFYVDVKNDHFISVTEALSIPLIRNERYEDMDKWEEAYHCDGLILLINNFGTMVLCNPALKESMILPEPNNAIAEGSPSAMGFGLDPENNYYKCVAIWCHDNCKVEVYTLGSDSWREINMSEDIMETIMFSHLFNGLCWKGVCYWLVHNPDAFDFDRVLSFNMSNEEFHLIHLPNLEDLTLDYYGFHLSVWNDSVVMYLSSDGDNSREYHLFPMDGAEAGAFSWTKYLHVGPLENVSSELSFWKNDEILMEIWKDGREQLASCNIRTQKFRDVVCDLDRIRFNYWACFYVKSLISIRRR
ncbi:putative F-box/LRR-repeat/kelch-repeat protein At1g11620 [Humulus lupulus]|uniref:putative F-box/LRR-repeat/kelch-repeat protein At1g11620 n=1 Tax=Humulus lupulus TaxID=3486 RepID=UPI002B414EA6|nr:putative F-box/LRR-repeat/kelch-repeat protein At1g11620 [Humulus lupulus]